MYTHCCCQTSFEKLTVASGTSERVACVFLPKNSRTVQYRFILNIFSHHLLQHPHGTHQRPVQRPPGSTLSMYCPLAYTFILSDHKRIKI
ncbi:hypothetical protein BDN71DRAFT_1451468 [Pleurotus eryngii]|uniref:Uncharacterized protein n=1 Tax=Pleurotus eryngii TaxID=5323 RepID=A0A9P5ZSU8_PLEER|nr:hypothetical protein BDN71DRAFT_1451468 [Pleurotus eryngii]